MASNDILLITGGNAGLGFETVRSLCQSSKAYTILLCGRNLDKAKAAVEALKKEFPESSSSATPLQLDVEDDHSISKAFEQVQSQYGKLDVLINNAGGQFDREVAAGKLTARQMWNKSWDVNTAGTYVVTHTFIPLLLKSSNPRLIFITSGTSTMGEHENLKVPVNKSPPKGWPKEAPSITAYRAAKAGMNMMMLEWVRILKEDGFNKIWCISPGMLATGLGGNPELLKKMGALDPTIGANFIRDVVEGARDQDRGKAIRKDDIQAW